MALNYLLSPEFQISVTSGKPNTGGWIEVFLAGTRTKYFTACDFNGTKNPFRIPLDSLGQAIVLADDTNNYDVFVYNRYGTLLFSRYNVMPSGGGGGEPGGKDRCVHRLLRYYTNPGDADEEQLQTYMDELAEIQELLDKACDKAVIGKVTRDELKEMIDLLYDEKQAD